MTTGLPFFWEESWGSTHQNRNNREGWGRLLKKSTVISSLWPILCLLWQLTGETPHNAIPSAASPGCIFAISRPICGVSAHLQLNTCRVLLVHPSLLHADIPLSLLGQTKHLWVFSTSRSGSWFFCPAVVSMGWLTISSMRETGNFSSQGEHTSRQFRQRERAPKCISFIHYILWLEWTSWIFLWCSNKTCLYLPGRHFSICWYSF